MVTDNGSKETDHPFSMSLVIVAYMSIHSTDLTIPTDK